MSDNPTGFTPITGANIADDDLWGIWDIDEPLDRKIKSVRNDEAKIALGVVAAGGTMTEHLGFGNYDSTIGEHPVLNILSNGNGNISFFVPYNFGVLVSLKLFGIPNGFTNGTADIDFTSEYMGEGEDFAFHSESDIISTYNFATAGALTGLDISGVFSSLSPNDRCALFIDHNSIGGNVGYKEVEMIYTPV